MLRSLDNLLGYKISATNGEMGTVADFFFVDDEWKVRYLVVTAGGWLNRKQVLVAMSAVREIADAEHEVRVWLTRESVYASPAVDTDKPVSRQKEILLALHYGWQPYWTPDPFLGVDLPSDRMAIDEELAGSNPHPRSFQEMTTYEVTGDPAHPLGMGFVTDLIANDKDWRVDGLVASSHRGPDSEALMVPHENVEAIDWTNRRVRLVVDPARPLARFDATAPVNQRRVVESFDYHGRLHHSTVLAEAEEG